MSEQIPFDILDRWDAEARELALLVLAAPDDELDRAIAGEWSPRQILAHMFDSEIVLASRMRAAIIQPGSAVASFQQDVSVSVLPYREMPVSIIADAFLALRTANTNLLKHMPDSAWEQTIEHPERGTQTLSETVRVFGDHFAMHLSELRSAYASRL